MPSTPALFEITVRSLTPESRIASISASGMPHRPKPPGHDRHAVLEEPGEGRPRIRIDFLHRRSFDPGQTRRASEQGRIAPADPGARGHARRGDLPASHDGFLKVRGEARKGDDIHVFGSG